MFALGLTLVVLASQSLFGPLANGAVRFYAAAAERGELGDFWAGLRTLATVASVIGFVVGVSMALILEATGQEVNAVLAVSAIAFALLSGWETLFDYVQSAQRRRWAVGWHQGLRQLLRPAIAGALITSLASERVAWTFTGYAIAAGLVVGSQVTTMRTQLRARSCGGGSKYRSQLLKYALPFVGWGLFTWVQLSSDRWALELTAGPDAVGRYAIVMQLGAQPIILFCTAAAQLFEPMIYAKAGGGDDPARLRSAFRLNVRLLVASSAFVVVIVLLEWLTHVFLFSLFAAPEYGNASAMLPVAGVSGGVFGLAQLMTLGSVVLGSSRMVLAPRIGTALFGTALNFAGAHWFGIDGVLIAGIITALLYGAWITQTSLTKYRHLES
jgi:O-antigen/teichoic acid export membrane protein